MHYHLQLQFAKCYYILHFEVLIFGSFSAPFNIGQVHVVSKTKKKKYNCSQCPYSTDISTNIRVHIQHHNRDGPYKCAPCSISYTTKYNYKRHMSSIIHCKSKNNLSLISSNYCQTSIFSNETFHCKKKNSIFVSQ